MAAVCPIVFIGQMTKQDLDETYFPYQQYVVNDVFNYGHISVFIQDACATPQG